MRGENAARHRTLGERFRDALFSGLAVIVPVVATLMIVGFSVNFLSDLLDPVVVVADPLLRTDTESFESVKLVEYDEPDVYAIAFRTSETPDSVLDATGCPEMETLYVSTDRIVDVDMTVAEGVRAVVTSGAASDDGNSSSEVPAVTAADVNSGG